ncbi:DNA binding protein [Aduncisulcus paluster]|uniref:DNA binding protein n=1 Tax=Aduncisulcus paluster TaxID=2918883 RepID=A0ABQ5KWG3_9EUKA|nr:DNA binding protein [Aduncisulcus paluster]|eukprot:gnl/Carplike_NY0171/385_a530_2677.p1 GENE.gnl/Carplike_NY0171/385_a530_2677~~gnl/Carplike_NY0171/385_a530_2677.p1  ORF type:complete len:361 (+),score=115.56 gnl/Carplike_NY0171/385_a530_2677:34-1116(+)
MEEGDIPHTPEDPAVLDKYQKAGEACSAAMTEVLQAVAPGVKVHELCRFGDESMLKHVTRALKRVKCEKGIAIPTTVCRNNIASGYSPSSSDDSLEVGDIVKIDLGVHIDGYVAQACNTIVVGIGDEPLEGLGADLYCSLFYGCEAALRLLRPGRTNRDVTKVLTSIAETFGVTCISEVKGYEMKQWVHDGINTIDMGSSDEISDQFEFKPWQVYSIDLMITNGSGKLHKSPVKPSIFTRDVQITKKPRMDAARHALGEIDKKFPVFPFHKNWLTTKNAAFGVSECEKLDCIIPTPILHETPGKLVARMKFTALITGSNTLRLTPGYTPVINPSKEITDPEILAILKMNTRRSKKKKGKK